MFFYAPLSLRASFISLANYEAGRQAGLLSFNLNDRVRSYLSEILKIYETAVLGEERSWKACRRWLMGEVCMCVPISVDQAANLPPPAVVSSAPSTCNFPLSPGSDRTLRGKARKDKT